MVHIYYNPTSGNVSNAADTGYEPYIHAQKVAEMKEMYDKETEKLKHTIADERRMNIFTSVYIMHKERSHTAERIYLWAFIALLLLRHNDIIGELCYGILLVIAGVAWVGYSIYNETTRARKLLAANRLTDEEIQLFEEQGTINS